jgi:asparagine synthase (glutamine-hydrolysing)
MCGIVGSIAFRGVVLPELVVRQRDTMTHRGPDSSGLWTSPDQRVCLGHRRLAIIDLSPGGHQPMVDAERDTVITFNGEIYNFLQLREVLSAAGYSFRTHSDTEVILAAYAHWGVDFLNHLEGMFALVLYDRRRHHVVLARDRAGEKPLYFHQNAERLTFASEIKAILADPDVARRASVSAINEYFAYGYATGSQSMIHGVHRLLPGQRMVIALETGVVAIESYWQLPSPLPPSEPASASTEALVNTLHDLLREAVTRQLVSDVPIGVLLSGGLDSSIVTAIAAQSSAVPVRTFTARFPGHQAFDEGPYARMVADHLGTVHTELTVAPVDQMLLEDLVRQFDDPISDSSMIPTLLVSREIRKHATVALGGDGGDELFGGYVRYPALLRQQRRRAQIPAALRRPLGAIGNALIPDGVRGRGALEALSGDDRTGYALAGQIFRAEERSMLSDAIAALDGDVLRAPELRRITAAIDQRATLLQRATSLDFRMYMVDDVLVKVDRAAMLASLEVRAPFLDRRVIEFAFGSVPDSLRATVSQRKVLLRRLGARLLPSALDLHRKQGFSIPIDHWMRTEWSSILDEAVAEESVLVSSRALRHYIGLLRRGRPVGERLFALVFLRLWERAYGITDVAA